MSQRVLFILHLPPPVHGAAVVGQFIKDSRKINEDIDGYYLNLSTSVSVDDIGKSGLKKIVRYVGLVTKAIYKAITFRPHIVYVTMTAKGSGFYKDAILVLFLKMLGKKVVFHFHNKGVKGYQNKKKDHFLYKRVFKNAKVILLSERLKEDVAKYVSDRDIYYCPNGIAASELPNVLDERNSSVPNVLFVGNLTESKGIYDLIDALQMIQQLNIAFKCTIIGSEGTISKEQLMEKIVAAGLETKINYLGRVIGKDKEALFKKADMLIHPSHEECFPLVLLEAMNFALPVISTYEGGIPDIVINNETGFLVEKRNVNDLKDSMIELLSDRSLREKFALKGRERFLESFTMDRFEEKFSEILKRVTDADRSS